VSGPTVLVVMGVSGVGKTTLGRALAERLGWMFEEGDELHPAANIAKMKAGVPLTDADRAPWLDAIGDWINHQLGAARSGVITCSALKRAYRDRTGHFMPPSLLASQFADLEPPGPDEPVIVVDGAQPIPAQVEAVEGAAWAS
jgi:gluconokinase